MSISKIQILKNNLFFLNQGNFRKADTNLFKCCCFSLLFTSCTAQKDTEIIAFPRAIIYQEDTLAPSAYTQKSLRFYKDKNHVFNKRMDIIVGLDPNSFEMISEELVKDKNHIYWNNSPQDYIKNNDIDAATFEFFGRKEGYNIFKDKHHVYLFYNRFFKIIKEANPRFFTKTFEHVFQDDKYIYDYKGSIIAKFKEASDKNTSNKNTVLEASSPSSITTINKSKLHYLDNGIFKDDSMVFSFNSLKVFEKADPNSFVVINDIYSKDENSIYRFGYPLNNYNPNTFEVLSNTKNGNFVKDKNGLYWHDLWDQKKLTDKVPENLEILPFDYAIFNNTVYHRSIKVKKADPKSFKILKDKHDKPAMAVDKNFIFWESKPVSKVSIKTVLEVVDEYEWLDNNNWYKLLYEENLFAYNFKSCPRIKANNLPTKMYYTLNNNAYYYGGYCEGRLIEKADTASFKMINEKYAKDKNHVYYEGKPIVQFVYLDSKGELDYCTKESFSQAQQLVRDGYTKEDIYENLKLFIGIEPKREEADYLINMVIDKIEAMASSEIKEIGIQPSTLQLFEGNHGKDDNYYFRNGSIYLTRSSKTENIDFKTFQGIGNSWGYYKDKNHVYDDDLKIMDGINLETLEPIYTPK